MRRLFADERAAGVATRALAYETAVRIPVGTALFEETLFRGLLLAWLRRRTTPLRAVAASSTLFGLWHILPTWETLAGYAGGVLRSRSPATAAATVGGAVVTTGLAGAAFSALRLRSGSLATPVIVHAAVNASGFVAAWKALRRRS
jgi:membrane protease YdiL (CAAX protease family)